MRNPTLVLILKSDSDSQNSGVSPLFIHYVANHPAVPCNLSYIQRINQFPLPHSLSGWPSLFVCTVSRDSGLTMMSELRKPLSPLVSCSSDYAGSGLVAQQEHVALLGSAFPWQKEGHNIYEKKNKKGFEKADLIPRWSPEQKKNIGS